ncbi:MAG: glutamate dehydrogenase, partial [Gammaproteobacteria bacterium]|nr:glutamate dehydrogenase [Gammaproteobacteria bacterium]
VTVSYYEWLQNNSNEQWELEVVNQKLQKRMYAAVDTVFKVWQDYAVADLRPAEDKGRVSICNKLELRTVALIIAIKRVANATLLRGIWP